MESTLEALREHFEDFLDNGGTRRTVSKEIKLRAIELLELYSYSEVGLALEVSDKTIRNWEKALGGELAPKHIAPAFIELPSIENDEQMITSAMSSKEQLIISLTQQQINLKLPYQSEQQVYELVSLLTHGGDLS